jgi:SAM-dependent methyltransferase
MTAARSVSVVVIFLDAEKFLAEALESVFAQDFADWELLLVDDGSRDRSTAIAQEYARRDPARVRYLEHAGHANRGTSASRNLGLRHAGGEYVAFLDADDVWVPGKLSEQLEIMRAHPSAAMVFGRTRYWYGWNGRPEDAARDYVRSCGEREDVLVRPPFFLSMTLLGGKWPSPSMSSVLLRRSSLERIGGFDESIRTMGEDTAFMVKVFLAHPVYYAGRCWDWYRQHPDSCSATATREGKIPQVNLDFLRWTQGYFARNGVTDPYLLGPVAQYIRLAEHPVLERLRPTYLVRKAEQYLRRLVRRHVPPASRSRLRRMARTARRPWLAVVRTARLRRLWRKTPVHREFGCYYGTPVDRVYIEGFLARNAGDIRGHVLEIGENTYTRRFGGGAVVRGDVLHAIRGNPAATLVADLAHAPHIQADRFDCVILTQTLQCIYDYRAALRTVHRILKPGGVLLATFPGVAHQISREERPYWGDYWRWTSMAAERVFAEVFPPSNVRVEARGNVLVCMALLHGLVVEELRASDFEPDDPDYELSLAVRAVKP